MATGMITAEQRSTTLLGLAVVIRLQSNKFSADWVYSSENYIREFSCAF